MQVEAPEGKSTWDLPVYFDKLNSQSQVWVCPVKSFSAAYGEVEGNKVRLVAQSASTFNVLVIARRSDPVVADYVHFVPA